ncbi:MAG: DUF2189 domain-containing protein [Rhizobiaceae bacterium]|jgi:uncharacterized membrane protein|nr:DUF2189 domain-containing protein [Rhizobiaceae bacterium]
MTQDDAVTGNGTSPAAKPGALPKVNVLTADDIRQCLMAGLADFARAPAYGMFFGAMVALCGIGIVMALTVLDRPWLIYPFAIGFPLVGPFLAVGLYEVSRRLQAGTPLTWSGVTGVMLAQRSREFVWMAFVVLFVFWIWMYQIRLLLAVFLGQLSFSSFDAFTDVLLHTTQGWLFLLFGHVIGAVLALSMFSLTVIAMPMLLEREMDFITAMITSVKAVITSPVPMLGWGLIVTLAVIAACVPFFLGLLIVLPVLGHATWHIYKRAVAA